MTAEGSVDEYDDEAQATLISNMAAVLEVDASLVSLTVVPASVSLVFVVLVADAAEADAVSEEVAASLPSAAAATDALGVEVVTDPVTLIIEKVLSPPPAGPRRLGSGRRRT